MSPDTQKAFANVLDTFTGADGGCRFIHLKCMIESLDKQRDVENAANQLITLLLRFSKLIDIANEPRNTSNET